MGDDLDLEAIAEAVEQRRVELAWNKKHLAEREAGIDTKTLYRVLNAVSVDDTTLTKLSKALRWDADQLERIGRGEPPPASEDSTQRLDRLEREVVRHGQQLDRLEALLLDLSAELRDG